MPTGYKKNTTKNQKLVLYNLNYSYTLWELCQFKPGVGSSKIIKLPILFIFFINSKMIPLSQTTEVKLQSSHIKGVFVN